MAKKPIVIVSVSGGVASAQVFPFGANVDIEVIDYDNIEAGMEVSELQSLIDMVKALPEKGSPGAKAWKRATLAELEESLEDAEVAVEDEEVQEQKDVKNGLYGPDEGQPF